MAERAAFLVMVDLDPIPGWGHEPESWQRHLEAHLLSSAGHYNPVVVEFTPTDLEPMKRAEREAGAAEAFRAAAEWADQAGWPMNTAAPVLRIRAAALNGDADV